MLFCLVSLAPKLFALIISQLLSCVPALCCPVFPICSVSGDVIVGAEGTFGYISFLEFRLYGGGDVFACVSSKDWDFLWSDCFCTSL